MKGFSDENNRVVMVAMLMAASVCATNVLSGGAGGEPPANKIERSSPI